MLRCTDGSYYVGHTDNLEDRIHQHQAGTIAGYTTSRRPVQLVYSQVSNARPGLRCRTADQGMESTEEGSPHQRRLGRTATARPWAATGSSPFDKLRVSGFQ